MRAGRRSAPRISCSVPVRIWSTDMNGKRIVQTARTVDVSHTGARLEWVSRLDSPGAIIQVQHRKEEARFCVAWIGKKGTSQEGQIGIHCLEPGRNIWQVTLPKGADESGAGEQEMHASPPGVEKERMAARPSAPIPVTPSWSGEERRKDPRYACVGGVEFYQQDSNVPMTGGLCDLSMGGCYVEMRSPLASGTTVDLILKTQDVEVRTQGEVRVTHPGLGMGIAFTGMSNQDREQLRQLVQLLARGGVAAAKPPLEYKTASPLRTSFAPESAPGTVTPGTAPTLEFLLELLQQKGILSQADFSNAMERLRAARH